MEHHINSQKRKVLKHGKADNKGRNQLQIGSNNIQDRIALISIHLNIH